MAQPNTRRGKTQQVNRNIRVGWALPDNVPAKGHISLLYKRKGQLFCQAVPDLHKRHGGSPLLSY